MIALAAMEERPMSYRTRQLLFSLATAGPFYVVALLGAWWIVTAHNDRAIAVRTAILLAPFAVLYAVLRYWPTRRRPARLYHLTTVAAAEAATLYVNGDGSVVVELRARKAGKAVYCFPRPPQRPSVLYWNLRAEPEVCIELHDIDFAGRDVRRRITGAYRLSGPLTAGASVHPFPASSEEDRTPR
jgi:hypothetical protein